jgi:hypothetical protein
MPPNISRVTFLHLILVCYLGLKNYLFVGSHDAAQRTEMLCSLLGSCKMNDVEPSALLKEVLTRLPDHKANKLHELLHNSKKSFE